MIGAIVASMPVFRIERLAAGVRTNRDQPSKVGWDHMRQPITVVDLENTATWTKYRNKLCDGCRANCCRMPVEATIDDLVRMGVLDLYTAQEPLKRIANRLKKAGVIVHYNPSRALFTLAQRANLDCIYLDAQSRRCTIYSRRPEICRRHPQVGPKPGYCPYEPQPAQDERSLP